MTVVSPSLSLSLNPLLNPLLNPSPSLILQMTQSHIMVMVSESTLILTKIESFFYKRLDLTPKLKLKCNK